MTKTKRPARKHATLDELDQAALDVRVIADAYLAANLQLVLDQATSGQDVHRPETTYGTEAPDDLVLVGVECFLVGVEMGVAAAVAELPKRGWREPAADDGSTDPLRFAGSWQGNTEYKSGNIVAWGGGLWVCSGDTREQPSPSATGWSRFVKSTNQLEKRVEQLEKQARKT